MPLLVLRFLENSERLALWAAIAAALGHGDAERTRTLIDGFVAELPGVKLEANVRLSQDYGEMIEIDDAVFKSAWLIERNHAYALTTYRAAMGSDQFQKDKPHNLAVALVAKILLEAIEDGTGLGLNRALQEAADRLAPAGRGSEGAKRLCYFSSKNTIRKYWLGRRGIAHLLIGLIDVEKGNLPISEFPNFCEDRRIKLSSNGPRRARAGSVYVPEAEQIRILCGDTGDAPEFASR